MKSKTGFLILFMTIIHLFNLTAEGKAACSNDKSRASSQLILDYRVDGEGRLDDIAAVSIFKQGDGAFDVKALNEAETLKLSGERLPNTSASIGQMILMKPASGGLLSTGRKKRIALSMISSALLPGLGELYLYFNSGAKDVSILTRAIGFMALEGYLWYGYDANHGKGKDLKRLYEKFGDENWSESRFLEGHPYCYGIGGCDSWEEYNESAKDDSRYFYYTAKEVDREEYYENMGKYDAFLYGWNDWEGADGPGTWDGDYDDLEYWTPNRTHFVSLRDESNKYLLRADRGIMGLIALRIVSVIHSGWIASKVDKRDSDEGWSFKLENSTVRSKFSLNYRF